MSILLRIAIGFLAGVFFILLASSKWRTAGRSLLFILIFEGVFRKWLLPAASDYIYFFKDWILIGSLIGLYRSGQLGAPILWRGVTFWMWPITILVSLEAFNPVMASPIAGLMGIKMWILWPMFIFLVPRLFDDMEQFKSYLAKLTGAFLVVAGLAMVQFALPSGHILNQYVREQESMAVFGDLGFARVCSTFPYLTGFTNYLAFCPAVFLPAALFLRGRLASILQFVVVPLLIGVSSMTGARIMIYYLSAYVPVFLFMGLLSGAIRIGKVVQICLITGGLTIVLVAFNPLFLSSALALIERTSAVSQGDDTAVGRSFGSYTAAVESPTYSIFGEGVGATMDGARNLASQAGLPIAPSTRYAESEPGRVMIETGIIGLVLWTGFKLYLMGMAWVMFRERKAPFGRAISLAVFLYLVILFPAAPSYDHTVAPFYWFNVGLLFLMQKFEVAAPGPAGTRPWVSPRPGRGGMVVSGRMS